MANPYTVLGVSQNATEEEIKTKYRELAKKYHPDNYADSPLAEFASEKMKEINEAYDAIMNERRGSASSGSSANNYSAPNSGFADVRRLILNGRYADAEQLLDGVSPNRRNAEWFFLKGSIMYNKGWMDDARRNFAAAVQMDPNNREYAAAYNRIAGQRNGNFGGYNPSAPNTSAAGCSGCDICSGLLCADCCCECMGGDLIGCC